MGVSTPAKFHSDWSAIYFKIVIVVDPFFSYVSFTLEMDRFCYVLAVNGKWKFWSIKYLIVHSCEKCMPIVFMMNAKIPH